MPIIKKKEEIINLKKAAQIGSNCFEYICSIIRIRNDRKRNCELYL